MGLLGEHGLAFWIELDGKKFLFDTGQGLAISHNARHLDIHPEQADAIILSHGHSDHTGGLGDVLMSATQKIPLYAHIGALEPKYIRNSDGTHRDIGIPSNCKQAVIDKAEFIRVAGPTEIGQGFYLTGPVPRLNSFEVSGKPTPKSTSSTFPHNLDDDQAAFIETSSGVVVILGCAHSGVINTLHYIQKLTGNQQIHSVIGGMHLPKVSPDRMDKTVIELRRLDIHRLIPCHCTGFDATIRLHGEFPGKCTTCPTGTVIEFER